MAVANNKQGIPAGRSQCYYTGKLCSDESFYKISSGVYLKARHLPITKEAFADIFNSFVLEHKDINLAFKRLCMLFDIYYNDDEYNESYVDDAFSPSEYLKRIKKYKKTFGDSLNEGFVFDPSTQVQIQPEESEVIEEEEQDTISQADINRWGVSFEPADYKILNQHLKLLRATNPNCDSNQEIFIIDLCYTKMQQMKAVREGRVDDFNKLTDSYRKSFTQAGLKTVKDPTATNEFTFGVNGEAIEKYTPAEYYRDKKLYKDYDGIGDYFDRFVFRPLHNIIFGTANRDKEFFVQDGGDTNDYIDEEE